MLHGWHVEMNNGVTGGTSGWPQRIFCVLKANLSREEEEEAMLHPAKAEATTRPGSPPTLLLLRDKSPCQNKKKLKKMWRMATVESNGGSLKDKSFNYLDFSKGLLTLLVYKQDCKQPLYRVHKGS